MGKRREPNFDRHCYYCYGYGYVERIGGGPRIKCIACDGSGRAEDWRAWQEAQSQHPPRLTPPDQKLPAEMQDG